MSGRIFVTISLCALAFAACDKKKEEGGAPATSASTPTTTAPSTSATVAAAALTDKDLPVKADFAPEVRKKITKANYNAELDKAETEIGKK